MLGAGGPKSLALAAELGDGVLLGHTYPDDEIAEIVAVVAAHAGGPDRAIVATQIAATGAGAQRRLDLEVPRWGKPAGAGIGVAGEAEAIAESVRRLSERGATSVIIQPTEDEPDLEGFVHFLGREVKPKLAE